MSWRSAISATNPERLDPVCQPEPCEPVLVERLSQRQLPTGRSPLCEPFAWQLFNKKVCVLLTNTRGSKKPSHRLAERLLVEHGIPNTFAYMPAYYGTRSEALPSHGQTQECPLREVTTRCRSPHQKTAERKTGREMSGKALTQEDKALVEKAFALHSGDQAGVTISNSDTTKLLERLGFDLDDDRVIVSKPRYNLEDLTEVRSSCVNMFAQDTGFISLCGIWT